MVLEAGGVLLHAVLSLLSLVQSNPALTPTIQQDILNVAQRAVDQAASQVQSAAVARSISIRISTPAPPPALLLFSAYPLMVSPGSASSLAFAASYVTTCAIYGGIYGGGQPLPSTWFWTGTTGTLNQLTTYTILCSGIDSNLYSATVTIGVKNRRDNLAVIQGYYQDLGTVSQVAEQLAKFDYVVLSHVASGTFGSCADTAYPDIRELVRKIRYLNPQVMIFGYVSSTADGPVCYNPAGMTPYTCGSCGAFINWVNQWLLIEDPSQGVRIDGIFIDIFGKSYITAATRDNLLSYVRLVGKKAMLNITAGGTDIPFATQSPYIAAGDILTAEGFYVALGNYDGANAVNTGMLMQQYALPKGIKWMALASEAIGVNVDCSWQHRSSAYSLLKLYGGSGFFYQSGDLTTQTHRLTVCSD